jgi:hypothetical protein
LDNKQKLKEAREKKRSQEANNKKIKKLKLREAEKEKKKEGWKSVQLANYLIHHQ